MSSQSPPSRFDYFLHHQVCLPPLMSSRIPYSASRSGSYGVTSSEPKKSQISVDQTIYYRSSPPPAPRSRTPFSNGLSATPTPVPKPSQRSHRAGNTSSEANLNTTTEGRDSRRRPYSQSEPGLDGDSLNEVVMAVDLKERGNVGCAYYVAKERALYFMEDVKFGGVAIVEACEF